MKVRTPSPFVAAWLTASIVAAQELELDSAQKINGAHGGFTGVLDAGDRFGSALAAAGDLDGNGVGDLLVGAPEDDDGGTDRGALWILYRDPNGQAMGHTKISSTQGGFAGVLANGDRFGSAVAPLGDLDGDGNLDIAVGAHTSNDGGFDRGSVWILFLAADESVLFEREISATSGGFGGVVRNYDRFGGALAYLGDVNGDGFPELAVGAPLADDSSTAVDRGCVWIVSLQSDGLVHSEHRIGSSAGNGAQFGTALASPGDLDGDGIGDLVVGVPGEGDAGTVRILFLDGWAIQSQSIVPSPGCSSYFGMSVMAMGDLDGDGIGDLAVGENNYYAHASVWFLFLDAAGGVRTSQAFGDESGVLEPTFGSALAPADDLDGDGLLELAVGVPGDSEVQANAGAVVTLSLDRRPFSDRFRKISATRGGLAGPLRDDGYFGYSAAALGDVNGDAVPDLAVGAANAIWTLFLRADGTVRSERKLDHTDAVFAGGLDPSDGLGASLAALGDLDGDGVGDLAAGATLDDDGGSNHGAVWILFPRADGSVRAVQKISDTQGGFTGVLDEDELFGRSLAPLGDLDGDGVRDLAVGQRVISTGTSCYSWAAKGAVSILFLNSDGTVKKTAQIAGTGLNGFDDTHEFSTALAAPGDLDGDGVVDLAVTTEPDCNPHGMLWIVFLRPDGSIRDVSGIDGGFAVDPQWNPEFATALGAPGDLDGDGVEDLLLGGGASSADHRERGAFWTLRLDPFGQLVRAREFSNENGRFRAHLDDCDDAGRGVVSLGDLDGDGDIDLAVGAPGDDDGGPQRGAVWIVDTGRNHSVVPLPPAPGRVFGPR